MRSWRKVCRPVKEITDRERELVRDMLDTMYDADGVGLAAPQVGILKRILVMVDMISEKGPVVMINPKILRDINELNRGGRILSLPGTGRYRDPTELRQGASNG